MKSTLERELKLRTPEGFVLPDLGGEEIEPRLLVASYQDTPDLRLVRAGVTFRHRSENGRGAWQLKLPRRGARLELEVAGPRTKLPAELTKLLVALVRRESLGEVARLRTRRSGRRVGGVEVVLDVVSVMDGRRIREKWQELEAELVEGDDEGELRRIGKRLRSAGAEPTDGRSKLARAVGVQPGADESQAREDESPAAAIGATLGLQLGRILTHDPGVRLGDDPEDVHQMRVATRRLRAFLRALRDSLDGDWGESLREELRWLAVALGDVRDLDVLIAYLREQVATLDAAEQEAFAPALVDLDAEHEAARGRLLAALDSDRYLALLDRLEVAAESPAVAADAPGLDAIFRRQFKRLRQRGGPTLLDPEASDEALHAVRIKAKRARYAAEFAAPVLGKRGRQFVEAAKELQDVLGEHQDATVAEERVRTLAARTEDPEARFAAGRLVERQRARRAAARAGLADVWERAERLGRRAAT